MANSFPIYSSLEGRRFQEQGRCARPAERFPQQRRRGQRSCQPWGPVLTEQGQGLPGIEHSLYSFHEALFRLIKECDFLLCDRACCLSFIWLCHLRTTCFYFKSSSEDKFLMDFRERETGGRWGERERERERNINVREKHRSVASYTRWLGSNPKPRHVPWLGIEPATHLYMGPCSNQLSHLARARTICFYFILKNILFIYF